MEACKEKCLNYVKNIQWQAIIARVKNLVIDPHAALNEVGEESISPKNFFLKYLLPVFGLLLIVDIIVWLLGGFKFDAGFAKIDRSLLSVLAINIYIIVMTVVISFVFFFLAKVSFFDTKASFEDSFKLVGSLILVMLTVIIPAHLISIFMSFLPGIILAGFFIYMLYVLWLGLTILLESNNKVAYLISAIICCIISGVIVSIPFNYIQRSGIKTSSNPRLEELEDNLDRLQERLQDVTRQ